MKEKFHISLVQVYSPNVRYLGEEFLWYGKIGMLWRGPNIKAEAAKPDQINGFHAL